MLSMVIGAARADVRVRPATPADIEAMHRIRLAVHENRLSDSLSVKPDDYRCRLAPDGISVVAESDGRLVGFGIADVATARIWALFVAPAWEGCGVGRRLHDALVDALFARGFTQLHLSTEPGTRAERFYRQAGWEPTGDTAGGEVGYRLTTGSRQQ